MEVYDEVLVEEVASDVELPVAYEDKFITDEVLEEAAAVPQQQKRIPDLVSQFIQYFYRNLSEGNLFELVSIYESGFNRISDKFYQKSSWPSADAIASLVNEDPLFLILYKELYYRHIYAKLQPTVEQRIESFNNYLALFDYLLEDGVQNLDLPNQWLWDIIDEFLYQFESFCRYRTRAKGADLERLSAEEGLWDAKDVMAMLEKLASVAKINQQLEAAKNGQDPSAVAGPFGVKSLYKMLGYFSLIGLLRANCSMGNFHEALRVLDHVELNRKGLFARVTACHVTTFYYVGFAYMMMRRYSDAIKIFTQMLLFVQRTTPYQKSRSHQFEMVSKKVQQALALLAICVSLCPQRIEEDVHMTLREKHGEAVNRMQRGEEGFSAIEELFNLGCPKFFSPSPDKDASVDNIKHQFLEEAKAQSVIPVIRSYLKLYSTLSLDKLAKLLDTDKDTALKMLLSFKQKSRQLRWVEGPLLSGVEGGSSDLDFQIKDDVIFVSESKVARRYGDYFLRHINKLNDVVKQLSVQ